MDISLFMHEIETKVVGEPNYCNAGLVTKKS